MPLAFNTFLYLVLVLSNPLSRIRMDNALDLLSLELKPCVFSYLNSSFCVSRASCGSIALNHLVIEQLVG